MRERLRRFFSSRLAIFVAALVAVLLLLPTTVVGPMMDDYTHRACYTTTYREVSGIKGDWDLFRFQDGRREIFDARMRQGIWPWWTDPALRLAFFRPLSSLTHAVDYRLSPNAIGWMRFENLLIYAAAVVFAGALYRRWLGKVAAAGLATWMYAIDDGHAVTAVWVANRNAILAAALGFAAIWAHDKAYRAEDGDAAESAGSAADSKVAVRDPKTLARLGAPLLFALSLLAGEAALGAGAYLFAHALWMQRGSLKARALAFAPYVAIVIAWAITYRMAGYGTQAGGFYIDPGREPLTFLRALVQRIPLLIYSQFWFPPADTWMLVPEGMKPIVWPIVVALVVLGAAIFVWGSRKSRQNAFFATGMVLSLVPVCATWPSDRLLIFAGLGAFGLIAGFVFEARDHLGKLRRFFVRALAFGLVALHAVLCLLFMPGRGSQIAHMLHDPIHRAERTLPPDDLLNGKSLVIVTAHDFLTPSIGAMARFVETGSIPKAFRQLSIAVEGKVLLRRTDERTVEVTLTAGYFHDAFSEVFRHRQKAMSAGERVTLEGFTAEVMKLASDGIRPETMRFTFDRPLSDPSLVWVTWQDKALVPFTPPAVGEEIELAAIDYQTAMSPDP